VSPRPRRGIFGGSFDPIHCGHLLVAERICDLERLDEIVFVPAWRSPHKRGPVATGEDRLAMLRAAVRGNPRFACSGLELRRGGPSYTIDTVRALARRWGSRPVLLLGGDALLDLPNWKSAAELLHAARVVVYARPGCEAAASQARRLGVVYHDEVISSLKSRDIRARVRRGESIRYQVPEAVRRHIERRGLYRGMRA
jgi:nicotinate-nucleotide adenylyltransferase